jgi:hypothetical protein
MTENKFELQSYFILYLLFVRILNLSKDIVSLFTCENNSCFARLCSFNSSDVENTSPQWHAFGSWCVSLCRAKLWLVEYAEYLFFVAHSANFFFQNLTSG